MADKWACEYAQDFFDGVKTLVSSVIGEANTIFSSVVNAMNKAGSAWQTETGSEFNTVAFSPSSPTLDASCIQENIAGVKGIDLQTAETTANTSLGSIESNVDSALSEAVTAVSSSGFIGESQQENLSASLEEIRTNVHSAIEELTSLFKTSITQTVASYGDTAGKVATAFAGNE